MQGSSNGVVRRAHQPKTPMQALGEIILLKRRRIGWTQKELSEAANGCVPIGLTQNRISLFEIGKAEPSIFEAIALSRAFGCELMEFNVYAN